MLLRCFYALHSGPLTHVADSSRQCISFAPKLINRGKTTEITRFQVGQSTDPVKLVVSTVNEAENLSEYLAGCRDQGRHVNILYGVPLPPSQIHRLGSLGQRLGPGSISVMIDHPAQLENVRSFQKFSDFKFGIYIKIDTGYHRAGILPTSPEFVAIVQRIFDDLEPAGCVELHGLYSHAGHSYEGDSRPAAMSLLTEEIQGLEGAVRLVREIGGCGEAVSSRSFSLSVGATPTTSSIQNLLDEVNGHDQTLHDQSQRVKACIDRIQANDCIELHAGVYPLLDLQQIATQASPSATAMSFSTSSPSTLPPCALSTSDIGLTILAEVASLYPNRSPPEALIAAGSLALGREPCKSYPGWGIVTDWGFPSSLSSVEPGAGPSGWQVGRISQEHGILTGITHAEVGDSGRAAATKLAVGQKVRIWPNHACVAGAGFGWYVVVDSSLPEHRRDEVVDIWVRWRGW